MTEFTRDIKQLQQTASQQPSFAPPSQSLGGDIVNLLGTGLDFYAKNKAQGELDNIAKKKAEESSLIDNASLNFRQWRLEVKDQLKGSAYLKGEQTQLEKVPRHLRSAVIASTNKLMGLTTYEAMNSAEKAQASAKTAREGLEGSALLNAKIAGISVDILELQSMDEKSLRELELAGIKVDAEKKVRLAELAEEHKQATTTTAKRQVESKGWLEITNAENVAQISVRGSTIIRNNGGVSAQSAPQIIKELLEIKKNIRNETQSGPVRRAREGVNKIFISQEDIDISVEAQERAIDALIDFASNEELLNATKNSSDLIFSSGLLKMIGSTNEGEARAASMLMTSKLVGLPQDLGNFNKYTKFVAGTISGDVTPNANTDKDTLIKALEVLSPRDPRDASERFLETNAFLEAYLDGTTSSQKAVVSSGAYGELVGKLAKEGAVIVDPSTRELQAERMYNISSKVLAATVQSINIQQSYKGPQESLYTTNPNTYELKTDNGEFKLVPPFPNAQPNTAVKQFNKLMKDQIQAFEELGMDKEYIDRFKSDIATSLSVFPTSRNG